MRYLLIVAAASLFTASDVAAGPLRLRGDAFYGAKPPVGLLVLQAEDDEVGWLDAEALVWTSINELDDSGSGDALVVTLRARDPQGRGEARVGRFVVATGAIVPRHIDGGTVRLRSPTGTDLELFGGLPVAPRFGVDAYDWIVGARLSHRLGKSAVAGVSYVHERDRGFVADEEVGVDVALIPLRWLDIAARAALDLVDSPGISEARLSAAARKGKWRVEAFAARRSPSRLLPATSLFSALGDVPSDELGIASRWRAAPRLDVWTSAAFRRIEAIDDSSDVGSGINGFEVKSRAALRLDDKGKGVLGFELSRQQLDALSSWTGARGTLSLPIGKRLIASSELELVIPDNPRGRGVAWPWALAAIGWRPNASWEAAAAVESRVSPESEFALSALLRVTRRWAGE
tara:strand:- start:36409 stop:37617 length:1209 start_codon:yes stop_codon:yes gene_type:complete